MNDHTFRVLRLPEVLEGVARHAATPEGQRTLRALRPRTDPDRVRDELAAVGEGMRLLGRSGDWSLPAVPDVTPFVGRWGKEGSVLDGGELRAVAGLLSACEAVARQLGGRLPEEPVLRSIVAVLPREGDAAREIERAIDPEGQVRDEASPELFRLRQQIRGFRSRIVERLDRFARKLPEELRVPDASVTIREGRYVIAVRREGIGTVGGTVHGESATGATIFVEPPVAADLMNRLRTREGEADREVRRILRTLTEQLRPLRPAVEHGFALLVRIDTLLARARYARAADASVPETGPAEGDQYRIVGGRHPLLDPGEAVPFDLDLVGEERTLLLTGPNTGGKTVLLAAVGLISLLAQSGVVPPVRAETRLPVFRRIFADVGDEQSIESSLSTFSAHLENLRLPLEESDPETLVLIDEIGTGTDPREGAALARAILRTLYRRGARTLASTHLGELKTLAEEDAEVVNASLQFDAERLQPTYRLVKGRPGRSYGLAIARRLGYPEDLLGEAESYLPEGERDVSRLLASLEAREVEAIRERDELHRLRREAAELRADLAERDAALRNRERDAERRARQQARDLLLSAREEVESAIREVRSAADAEALGEAARGARRRVEEAANRQRERKPAPVPEQPEAPAPAIGAGDRVRVGSIGQTATVVEIRDDRARVETGGIRLELPLADLTPVEEEAGPRPKRAGSGAGAVALEMEAHPEVDLRGQRVGEMEAALTREMDAAFVSGLSTFRIIHGKGTGALRERVGEILERDPRVSSFRPGERGEGGTGVTVVEFR